MRLFLWDIDGTLLWTGGAGAAAMERAFARLYGVADAFRDIAFSGRTDPSLFREALARHDLPDRDFPAALAAFETAYLAELGPQLRAFDGNVLPGVMEVLAALAERGSGQGVATGNFRRGADLKLAYYGLSQHLGTGAYGSDAEDRAELVALAAQRLAAEAAGGATAATSPGVVVIGDSALDIAAARANGFAAVGVATGHPVASELAAAGADVVFQDLGDVERAVTLLWDLADGHWLRHGASRA